MDVGFLVNLASGAVAALLVGRRLDPQGRGHALAGAIGGGIGAHVVSTGPGLSAAAAPGLDTGALVSQTAGGAIGGAVVVIIVALAVRLFDRR